MPLDPAAARLLRMLNAGAAFAGPAGAPVSALDRRTSLCLLSELAAERGFDSLTVEDHGVPAPAGALRLRRYAAEAAAAAGLLFVHGGGFTGGDLETHDGFCRRLAAQSLCQVFALEYRLAPEHPHPAGLEDVLGAFAWLGGEAAVFGLDPMKLAIGGDSAGANLAAAACLRLRDEGRASPALQLLVCPILDLAGGGASRQTFARGYFLDPAHFEADLRDYAGERTDLDAADLSPLRAADLGALPPAQIHLAEFDGFRDEGRAYAERLRAAGVEATLTEHAGMIHYFYALAGAIPAARPAVDAMGVGLAERLAK
jgi:acetyl esterase/lipase